ncbi:MerR family transcriptional regulator [Acidocella sp.]|uniref:MerR family transcriptional regulator n=1 Tax=Acidocella sp. TaxID=50710 RepID=UPI00262537AD|nr:MerR family transcriptional regulator [Acidocella sp.]
MVDEDFNAEDEDGLLGDAGVDAARPRPRKTADAFRTISEVADELHVPQHVLRFWETKFPQVRPLKRGGGRRYYRPEDVQILRRVADLLYTQGYTIKGVQRLLRDGGGLLPEAAAPVPADDRVEIAEAAPEQVDVLEELEVMKKPVVSPQLPMPGLLPAEQAHEPHADMAAQRPAQLRVRPKGEAETERLRMLLTETLGALEELRRLLD